MVERIDVVLNVMLPLMYVMSPHPALCNLLLRTVVKLCTLGALGALTLWGELGFLNCDDICMCVVNKQFEPRVFYSVYVHLQYDEISLTFLRVCLVFIFLW